MSVHNQSVLFVPPHSSLVYFYREELLLSDTKAVPLYRFPFLNSVTNTDIAHEMFVFCCECIHFLFLHCPLRTLAVSTAAFHWTRFCDLCLQFLRRIISTSFIETRLLMADLPTCLGRSVLSNVRFTQGSCSCILHMCPSHLNLPALITFAIFGHYVKFVIKP
jgi:hypothetical protein